jgi:transcriptional regulator with XRE-family HTH domain
MNNERTESATVAREAIAAKVRGAVAEHQKTQREIGEILGLPQSVVQLRLKGERPFRAEELAKLAAGLGVPVERFFEGAATAAGAA